jgi:hypothetical protein
MAKIVQSGPSGQHNIFRSSPHFPMPRVPVTGTVERPENGAAPWTRRLPFSPPGGVGAAISPGFAPGTAPRGTNMGAGGAGGGTGGGGGGIGPGSHSNLF